MAPLASNKYSTTRTAQAVGDEVVRPKGYTKITRGLTRSTRTALKTLMPPKSRSRGSGATSTLSAVTVVSRNKISAREVKSLGLTEKPAVTSKGEGTDVQTLSRPRTRAQARSAQLPVALPTASIPVPVQARRPGLKRKVPAQDIQSLITVQKHTNTARTKAAGDARSTQKPKLKQAANKPLVSNRAQEATEQHSEPRTHCQRTGLSSIEPAVPYFQQNSDPDTRISAPVSVGEDYINHSHWPEPVEDYLRALGVELANSTSDGYSMSASGTSTPVGRLNAAKAADAIGYPKIKKPSPDDKDFDEGLLDRYVVFASRKDPHDEINKLKEFVESQEGISKVNPKSEGKWKKDLSKCKSSLEAIFQHTVMMDAIDRHTLKPNLDFACEAEWTSNPPPRKTLAKVLLPNPKSDLIIGFRPESLFEPTQTSELGTLKERVFPETYLVNDVARAFPFLAFEVKGRRGDIGDKVALRQMLNTATLALYNVWKFVEGLPELRERFSKEVRFFTATGNGEYLYVYMHWAVEVAAPLNRVSWDSSSAKPVVLVFYHETLEPLKGDSYTRVRAIHMVKNILRYGEDKLLKFLNDAIPLAVGREMARDQAAAEELQRRQALQEISNAAKRRQRSASTTLGALEFQRASSNRDISRGRSMSRKRGNDDLDGTATETDSIEPASGRQNKKNNAHGLDNMIDEAVQVNSASFTSSAASEFARNLNNVDLHGDASES